MKEIRASHADGFVRRLVRPRTLVAVAVSAMAIGAATVVANEQANSPARTVHNTAAVIAVPPTPATTSSTLAAASDRYVNIGDSYSAGEGTYSYVAGTNTSSNMCHRSTLSYSGQYASSSPRYNSVRNVACSGADTSDLTSAPGAQNSMQIPTAGELAQTTALSANTQLVTMTIGANNLNLPGIATRCYQSSILKSAIESCFVNTFNSAFFNQITNLRYDLDNVYRSVVAAAPKATVAVLTYPQIFPKTYTGADCTAPGHATILNAGISQVQINLFRKVTTALDNSVRAAAHDVGLTVLDEENAFAGREACTSDPYVNGLVAFGDNESLHPDVAGYAKEAADVKAYFDAVA